MGKHLITVVGVLLDSYFFELDLKDTTSLTSVPSEHPDSGADQRD